MQANLSHYEDVAELEDDILDFLPTVSDLEVFGCEIGIARPSRAPYRRLVRHIVLATSWLPKPSFGLVPFKQHGVAQHQLGHVRVCYNIPKRRTAVFKSWALLSWRYLRVSTG